MNKDVKTRQALNNAVDSGNINMAEEILSHMKTEDPPMSAREFAKDIIKLSEEEHKMKKSYKIAVVTAAAAVLLCTGVCAASYIKTYEAGNDNFFVSIMSDKDIDTKQVDEMLDNYEMTPDPDNTLKADDYDRFSSVEEAEKAYNINVAMPDKMPELPLSEITGLESYLGENSKEDTLWICYGDSEDKAFEITADIYDIKDDDVTTQLITDSQLQGTYVSEKGYKFNILKETDETGEKEAYIMETIVGKCRYALVFAGFDEDYAKAVTDSLDLEIYK